MLKEFPNCVTRKGTHSTTFLCHPFDLPTELAGQKGRNMKQLTPEVIMRMIFVALFQEQMTWKRWCSNSRNGGLFCTRCSGSYFWVREFFMLMVGKFFFGEEVFFIFQKLFSSYGVLHALEVIFQLREMGKFVMFVFFFTKTNL